MFLSELAVQPVHDSEVSFSLCTSNTVEVVISANTSNERNNWLKTIAIAKRHIEDTERSLTTRRQSRKSHFLCLSFLLDLLSCITIPTLFINFYL